MNYQLKLKAVINFLEEKKIIKKLENLSSRFYDEPPYYFYVCEIFNSPFFKKRGYLINTYRTAAGAMSFTSKPIALLKCLSEATERFCQFCFSKNQLVFSSFNNLSRKKISALDPTFYREKPGFRRKVFGWIKGYNFTKGIECLIPAHLAYLNYLDNYKEELLTSVISTGAAAGFSPEGTLLTGLYEVIERDATMTMYLNKIPIPFLDLNTIPYPSVKKIIASCLRYKLEVYIFNLTNDLQIPVIMAIVIDRTGIGPAITVGSRANFNVEKAIIGSIGEALMPRQWIRTKMIFEKTNTFKIKRNELNSNVKTYLFWSSKKMISKLNFLLKQNSVSFRGKGRISDEKTLLNIAKKLLAKKNYKIYYVDLTLPEIRKLGYFVYKVIIPSLQPLYIDQTKKELSIKRLKTVASFFNKRKFRINSFPHPFP